MDNLKTVRDWIRYAASQFERAELFYGHGTETALDEAAALVLHVLKLPWALPERYYAAALTEAEKNEVKVWISRRIDEAKPLAYLTREAWFAGLPFYVDERVLVPRSPMAELIEQGFAPWVEPRQVQRVLDLCTGCGCIGLATAMVFPEARVDLADVSEGALEVAQMNVDRFGLGDRVTVVHSDVFDGLAPEQPYDVILCNPPYVPTQEWQDLPREYHHEPRLGLDAGEDGMQVVDRVLFGAADKLQEGGVLFLEVGYSEPILTAKYPQAPFVWLDFEQGGQGVCLLTREQLRECFQRM